VFIITSWSCLLCRSTFLKSRFSKNHNINFVTYMYVWCIIFYDTHSFHSEYCIRILIKNMPLYTCHILLRLRESQKVHSRIGAQRCLHFCTRKLLENVIEMQISQLYICQKSCTVQTNRYKHSHLKNSLSDGSRAVFCLLGQKMREQFHSSICIANFWAKTTRK
jgi:hypothetical protein